MTKIGKNLARFREAIYRHDEINPTHKAWGIGLSSFDMKRLGFDEGEELWPGIIVQCDYGQSAMLRVLCEGQHDDKGLATEVEAREMVHAVGAEA
jgi:hypothetical protein